MSASARTSVEPYLSRTIAFMVSRRSTRSSISCFATPRPTRDAARRHTAEARFWNCRGMGRTGGAVGRRAACGVVKLLRAQGERRVAVGAQQERVGLYAHGPAPDAEDEVEQ